MLSVEGPGAPPPATMHDQDDDQEGFGLYLADETKSQCKLSVVSTLPDIDPEYLARVCTEAQWDANRVIDQIFDQMDSGRPYPRIQKPNLLKRKRVEEEEPSGPDKTAAKFDNEERRRQLKAASYKKTCDMIMQQSFPEFYAEDLRKTFVEHGNCLYPAFLQVAATVASSNNRPPYRKKSRVTQIAGRYDLDALADRIRTSADQGEREALEEFRALREVQAKQRAESEVERKREEAEKTNLETAMLEGNIADCGCCFVEYALNRMVHCDGDTLHWFCRDCARMMAETQIGLSKYRLDCMSTDGCTGSFAMDQKEIFLDAHSMTALDRIEQEAVLREAGIENLETCPQCPFAAEYPPIEEDKEFRCLNPECAVTSCRACRKETHVPKTCAEAALDNGHSARHEIEEAMSGALIRTCNKCSAPFIKENGCNKMTCTKCRNIQCYVCSQSCDYSHFNDASRGGKSGNCPLFDDGYGVEKRHQEEVRAAEEQARKRAREMHPEVQADLLEFKVSDKVKKDEEEKASAQQHIHYRHHHHHHRPGGRLGRMVRFHVGNILERAGDNLLGEAQQPPQPQPQPQPQPRPQHQPQPPPLAPPAAAAAPRRPQPWYQAPEVNGAIPAYAPAVAAARRRHLRDRVQVQPQRQADPNKPPDKFPHAFPRPQPQVPPAQSPIDPAARLYPDIERLYAGPRDQAARPPQQAGQLQVQPFVDPRAVLLQPPAPAPVLQPEMGFWGFMQDLQGPGPPMDAMDEPIPPWSFRGLFDHYRQSEHPGASPVGNGQVGDANQVDHRNRDPAREEPAIIDEFDLDLWNLGDFHEDLRNPAMNVGDIEPRFNEMAHGQLLGMDGGLAEHDRARLFPGPVHFGFDDLAFK